MLPEQVFDVLPAQDSDGEQPFLLMPLR